MENNNIINKEEIEKHEKHLKNISNIMAQNGLDFE
jgi:hypothetical protein